MTFVHDDPEFELLIRVAADATPGISTALVEKDYWVTHSLWALQNQGFDIWLKGGTSLSKGFDLIKRFSEDLDLKIEPGTVAGVPAVDNRDWVRDSNRAKQARIDYFQALEQLIHVPGAPLGRDAGVDMRDPHETRLRVQYPGKFARNLPRSMRQYVLLEIGVARVTPNVETDMSSFVHDQVAKQGLLAAFDDNRPRAVRCIHPWVTAIEKLNIITSKYSRDDVDAADFVRHYEDVACIVRKAGGLPTLDKSNRELWAEMVGNKKNYWNPAQDYEALRCPPGNRRDKILRAYHDIGPMFWGPRIGLDEACETIRTWIAATF